MLPTIKSDAPIFEAFLGKNDLVTRVSKSLEQSGVVIPAFENREESIQYLNLKVDSAHLSQSVRMKDTQEVGDTLFIRPRRKPPTGEEASRPATAELKDGQFPRDGVLSFIADDPQRVISVRPAHDMLIGRRDSTFKEPDVDFSLWGGFYQGVSRRHAKLSLSPRNFLEITDLASANGTFINGKRLKPFIGYPLKDGDNLTIGKLAVRVAFEDTHALNPSPPNEETSS
jgi:pSer/pThr/pTyr-binding forkhead associated (FHA) protein